MKASRVVAALGAVAVVGAIIAWRMHERPERRPPLEGARGQPPVLPSAAPTPPDAATPSRPPLLPPDDVEKGTLAEQREQLFARMQRDSGLSEAQLAAVRAIFQKSAVLSQGNPKITRHPMTRSECWSMREKAGLDSAAALAKLARAESACGARFMVPIPRVTQAAPEDVCIDQYEFPDIPCEYPVTFVSAKEASELCHAVGKRLCDAHEWEGACVGEMGEPDGEYLWDRPRRIEMEYFKNLNREKVWAYGPTKDHGKCATASRKSPKCGGGIWETCGSNTYPAGAFPECVSRIGVYDQHGNAAEHMNLPMNAEELGSRGGLGETEMKGSWFIFSRDEAHEDDCRWRAPAWHATRVDHPLSHLNYHLGFRCCKDLK